MRVLGQVLVRDTIEVVSAAAPSEAFDGQPARTLLAHRPLERYLWLIRRGFDDSLWDGPGDSQARANFPLIWRIATGLYESTLESHPAALHVCHPTADEDEFECRDEAEPVRMIPIPSPQPALLALSEPTMG